MSDELWYNGQYHTRTGVPQGNFRGQVFGFASLSASGTVIGAVAGKKIRVLGAFVNSLAATNVKFQSNSSDISGIICLAANGGAVLPATEAGWFETQPGEALNLSMTISTTVGVQVIYVLA